MRVKVIEGKITVSVRRESKGNRLLVRVSQGFELARVRVRESTENYDATQKMFISYMNSLYHFP